MATIKAIEGQAVHQIQSGQVIVDLCSVVKELVENSLDAGATSIDIRFKNQGLDSIEVQDNGNGISPQNYETIALKHYTSKLSKYSDLLTLKSFGFRGEALSSLCALAKVSIVTCMAQDAPKGTKLEFDVSGKLKETCVVAAPKGTTVSVRSIFENLPVRRRGLVRNIKREWSKVTSVLSQYACIQVGIKFSVSQLGEKDKRTTIFSTKGSQSFKDNIINVFGAKMLTNIVPLDLELCAEAPNGHSKEQHMSEIGIGITKNIRIIGQISRPNVGDGRQVPDRQMFFVNSRPCSLPQVAKTFNEVFKLITGSSNPFIFANFELDTRLYDVNVSPDKRTILLHNQDRILESLRSSLAKSLELQQSMIPMSQFSVQKTSNFKQTLINIEGKVDNSNSKSSSTSKANMTQNYDSKESLNRYTESGDDELNINSYDSTVEPESPSLGSRISEKKNMIINSSVVKENVELVTRSKNQEICNITKELINNCDALQDDTKRDIIVTKTSGISNDTINLSAKPNYKRLNESLSFSEKSPERPFPKKLCKPHEFDTRFEEFLNHIPPNSDISSSFTRRCSGPSFQNNKLSQSATITIGDNTTTKSLGTLVFSENTQKVCSFLTEKGEKKRISPTKVPEDFSKFGSNFSRRFSAPNSENLLQTSLNQHIDLSDQDLEDIESQKLSQTSLAASENTGDSDDVFSGTSSTPGVSDFTNAEDLEQCAVANLGMDIIFNDEAKKKACEEAKIQRMIREVEISAKILPEDKVNRSESLLKGLRKRNATLNLVQTVKTNVFEIKQQLESLEQRLLSFQKMPVLRKNRDVDHMAAEEKLSLKISKGDFSKMRIIGQFNLGFILASRSSHNLHHSHEELHNFDDIFIIDQHASDEKYNFERLQATTIVQSQKLAVPKILDLTALEEEVIIENLKILQSNGFGVRVNQSDNAQVGNRCELISLPLSHETTFSLSDLEELLTLLTDHSPGGSDTIPRPSKVRKMFAMRACRSSIMIGKTLTQKQMKKVVLNLGELDKPWNCPHGRPTMRHLCGLEVWDDNVWKKDVNGAAGTNWLKYLEQSRMNVTSDEEVINV
ncbi:putative dna mismatch repair protein [Erysiphe necator]|uniref:DNA mismatch repair protein PMS1 n=1 Tax=Uncinula necator TaxID=52586 RepID=A0A0B1P1I1_UNCNE|nr:putative dna mismatch repair protein [Erysiphe necator]